MDSKKYDVNVISYNFENNDYISLRDVAHALKDTGSAFDLSISSTEILITLDKPLSPSTATSSWTSEYAAGVKVTLKTNDLKVNNNKVKYYTIKAADSAGVYDCFMSLIDISMVLDIDIKLDDEKNIVMDTEVSFNVDPDELYKEGYFEGVNSVMIGDATTGEVWYGYDEDEDFPIASTTKLMTYIVFMDAVSNKEVDLNGATTVSKAGQDLAEGPDGVVPLKEGMTVPNKELIDGMLLKSSNECALTLAEAVSGSESAFIERMNEKAREIGLTTAVFYNSNGLPVYSGSIATSKTQNRMSAEDMFKLTSYLLKVYPQVKDITSKKEGYMDTVGIKIETTNALLYNIPETTGLKSGTTIKAGCCLVTSLQVDDHDLVVVLFGAESGLERVRVSEVLSRYAILRYKNGVNLGSKDNAVNDLPGTAEGVVMKILRSAQSKKEAKQ